ncbi:ABC transporter ATP-binding protein [Acidisphaera sp. L21]|uniref:ABC transporter ATP-binding protein n=1 Tax=Acidisphaera sp. L21 TaxID=1641851 RepID=UPI00131E497A|nr:ABC transporter ATP-binding protein [Acidisphaera sp. L21]
MSTLVEIDGLTKEYPPARRNHGPVRAVDHVGFTVDAGETLGLVGESGCGKTTVARTILHLTPPTAGRVLLDGTDTVAVLRDGSRKDALRVRRAMQYVFQDPLQALNPRWTAGDAIAEPLRVHSLLPRADWQRRVEELLDRVGMEPAHAARYPHELSGGQRQRVGIARALAVQPRFLICDEPVSSLDVSVRAQILNLLGDLQDEFGLAYLFISHDLASVRSVSHRVAVMYLGRIVEMAPADALFASPLHHYTAALLAAVPVPDPDSPQGTAVLAGEPPSATNPPPGCHFHPRCAAALPVCQTTVPPLAAAGEGRVVACHNPR